MLILAAPSGRSTVRRRIVILGILGFLLYAHGIIAVLLNVIWFAQLILLLHAGERIEYTFSVYIIDLCSIMPD